MRECSLNVTGDTGEEPLEPSPSYDGSMRIVRIAPNGSHVVFAGADLFDAPPTEERTAKFLSSEGHHLLVAVDDEDKPIGFVSGVETTHPDKGTEMFLYELSVHPEHRNRGVGRSLVEALADLARDRDCYGMWVATESDNVAALATYHAAGATPPDACVTLSWTFEDRSP
jgi:GNAT superfamily N-acetyltransferase